MLQSRSQLPGEMVRNRDLLPVNALTNSFLGAESKGSAVTMLGQVTTYRYLGGEGITEEMLRTSRRGNQCFGQ